MIIDYEMLRSIALVLECVKEIRNLRYALPWSVIFRVAENWVLAVEIIALSL